MIAEIKNSIIEIDREPGIMQIVVSKMAEIPEKMVSNDGQNVKDENYSGNQFFVIHN